MMAKRHSVCGLSIVYGMYSISNTQVYLLLCTENVFLIGMKIREYCNRNNPNSQCSFLVNFSGH